jgi:hypothetical protein
VAPPYECKQCGQQFWSLTEMIDPWGEICRSCSRDPLRPFNHPEASSQQEPQFVPCGYVYLLRAGLFYKIGMTTRDDPERRLREIRLQLPFPIKEVHRIATDDPEGIERYWHQRFSERRKNGEWFELSDTDARIFRCRDRM